MNWTLLTARDSRLWEVLFYTGFVVVFVAGFIDTPEDYGLGPVAFKWLKLVAAVIAALGGKFGLSPARSTREIQMGGK